MLQLYAFPQLEHLQPNVFFEQDGAQPHWSLDVRRALNATFPGRWIGRDGPTVWPPRSPDVTPSALFLWGYVKDRISATTVRDLLARTVEAVGTITPDLLLRTWAELEYRLDILRVTDGAHVEMYWFYQIKLDVLCDWYLSINRSYLYSLLPDNTSTINFGRFVVDTL
jgi:hypothetical protein